MIDHNGDDGTSLVPEVEAEDRRIIGVSGRSKQIRGRRRLRGKALRNQQWVSKDPGIAYQAAPTNPRDGWPRLNLTDPMGPSPPI